MTFFCFLVITPVFVPFALSIKTISCLITVVLSLQSFSLNICFAFPYSCSSSSCLGSLTPNICYFVFLGRLSCLLPQVRSAKPGMTVAISGRTHTHTHLMWEVLFSVRSLRVYLLAATMVFIKTLAWCLFVSDEETVMGMTRSLRGADVTAHPLKGLLSRPCTALFSLSHIPSSITPSPLSCSPLWELARDYVSWGFLHIPPFMSSFFPPAELPSKSLPSSLIPLFMVHHRNASSTQTTDIEATSYSKDCPRICVYLSQACGKFVLLV